MIQVTSRPASSDEQGVIKRALEAAAAGSNLARLKGQISSLRIVARCECGCASVRFAAPAGIPRAHVVADALAKTSAGNTVGVMVWGTDDALTGLEVYSMSAPNDASLPMPDSVNRW
ncbi:MAG TPA: hypothetical protein VHV81_00900 [Steroidobacteraceae bacterium]|jgi:hypothetical protein|nr:hypothetical protein [Steroidobacteraceae bacterium]